MIKIYVYTCSQLSSKISNIPVIVPDSHTLRFTIWKFHIFESIYPCHWSSREQKTWNGTSGSCLYIIARSGCDFFPWMMIYTIFSIKISKPEFLPCLRGSLAFFWQNSCVNVWNSVRDGWRGWFGGEEDLYVHLDAIQGLLSFLVFFCKVQANLFYFVMFQIYFKRILYLMYKKKCKFELTRSKCIACLKFNRRKKFW